MMSTNDVTSGQNKTVFGVPQGGILNPCRIVEIKCLNTVELNTASIVYLRLQDRGQDLYRKIPVGSKQDTRKVPDKNRELSTMVAGLLKSTSPHSCYGAVPQHWNLHWLLHTVTRQICLQLGGAT